MAGKTWRAWLSDGLGNSPSTTFDGFLPGVPIRLVDGTQVADSYADLINPSTSLDSPISVTEWATFGPPGAVGAPPSGATCAPQAPVRTATLATVRTPAASC